MSLVLAKADKFADQLVADLQPYCDRIAVAGSIRRRRPVVNDIDLVVLARDRQAVRKRCAQKCTIKQDGLENFIVVTSTGVQIDIFFAAHEKTELFQSVPGTWGTVLLCRTGSINHNIFLVEHAKKMNLRWIPNTGVFDADFNCLASETEEQIFEALKLNYLKPELRDL